MLLPSLLTPGASTAGLRRLRPTPEQLTDFRAHLAEMLTHFDPTKIEPQPLIKGRIFATRNTHYKHRTI